jgi:hypothetical protein
MPANGIAEHGHKKVRTSVNHPWMFRKIRRGVYHAKQLHDALHFYQGAKCVLQHGEQIDTRDSRMLVGLPGGDRVADLTRAADPARFYGPLAGQKEQVPFLNIRNEIRDWLRRWRQNNAKFPKSIFGRWIAAGGAWINRVQEIAQRGLESRALQPAAAYLEAARRACRFWYPVCSPAITHLRRDRGLVPTSRTVRARSGGM